MKSKYKVIVVITSLLVILSASVSIINYLVSLNNAEQHLKQQSLPLSLDNIYSDIQKNIIEPYLVSSMMANDTFVHDWLHHEESNQNKIVRYLESIKNKYNMFNTFLVSDKTKNYYTPEGFIEKVKKDNPQNKWYFDFENIQNNHEINLDFNENMSNDMIMFINYKIFDSNFHYIGATGIAIKISYINDLLKNFRVNHKFQVVFYDPNGQVILAERDIYKTTHIDQDTNLRKFKDLILSKNGNHIIEYEDKGKQYIINTKYIPELDLHLAIQANLDDFTEDVKKMLYLNLLSSIFITIIIAFIVFFIIKKYSNKLEYLSKYDPLTTLSNRRSFEDDLERELEKNKRKKQDISLIFLDLDDFKKINDTFGHHTGDIILKEVGLILKNMIRKTDLIARWGGEEFVIALIDSPLNQSKDVSEKIRSSLSNNNQLKKKIDRNLTASLGLTMLKEHDTIETLLARADEAMYISKNNNKNQVTIL
jgi:diguanylate cyclase (GGDEF)-like protein